MKPILTLIMIIVLSSIANAQSGRRVTEIKTRVSSAPEPVIELKPRVALPVRMSPAVEINKDYRCVSDGVPERIGSEEVEETSATKEIDSGAQMRRKPRPAYTKEARRLRIQGFVTLRVLLSASGKISRVRVMKGLRAGLTENAIRAACKIEFRPAIKTGQPVAQWVTAEYVFRFADSFIFRP
jgi:TonB family protein